MFCPQHEEKMRKVKVGWACVFCDWVSIDTGEVDKFLNGKDADSKEKIRNLILEGLHQI